MNCAEWLHRQAVWQADQVALACGLQSHATWREWARRARAIAGGLRHAGLQPGDRVMLLGRNSPEYLEALLGIWWAGMVAVPVNAKLHEKEAAYIAAQSGARLLLLGTDWAAASTSVRDSTSAAHVCVLGGSEYSQWLQDDAGPAQPVQQAAKDLAWLFYTSGTTGRPKGAMLTHGNLQAMAFNYLAQVDGIAPGDSILHAAPLSHGSGLYALPHLMAGALQIVPASGVFDEPEVISLLAHYQGVTLFAAPTIVNRLVAQPDWPQVAVDGLKTLVYGGGPMYVADLLTAMKVLPGKLAQIYGQGETPMTITTLGKRIVDDSQHPRHLARVSSVGRPFAGVEVRLVDTSGTEVPCGEVGEVCVRGDTVMAGYWQDTQATAQALRVGWLWTGDLGQFDEEGFLTLKDRSKDLIISGGSNIYPREVEEVLLMHPGVAEVSVIGQPDTEWGEVVVACVVGHAGFADAAALDAHCLAHIARFKRPKQYRFLSELPKNAYGKVLKTQLREGVAIPPVASSVSGSATS